MTDPLALSDHRPHLGGQVGADEEVHPGGRLHDGVALDLRLLERLPGDERAPRGLPAGRRRVGHTGDHRVPQRHAHQGHLQGRTDSQ